MVSERATCVFFFYCFDVSSSSFSLSFFLLLLFYWTHSSTDCLTIGIWYEIPFQTFGKDYQWHWMSCPIQWRLMCSNNQILLDQKTIRYVITPQDSNIFPIDVMTGVFLVFGERRENDIGIFAFRSFDCDVRYLLFALLIGRLADHCFHFISNSWRTSCWQLLLCLHLGIDSARSWTVVCFVCCWRSCILVVDLFSPFSMSGRRSNVCFGVPCSRNRRLHCLSVLPM